MRKYILAALLLIPFIANSQQVTTLKFADFSPDREFIFNNVIKPFANEVEKATNGSLKIELYPNGALGRAPAQQAQLVLDGVADIAFVVPPFTPGRFPDTGTIELPGLFKNFAEATTVFTRMVNSGLIRDYNNYVILAAWTTPPFSIHGTKPIKTINDLRGKKIRASGTMQNDTLKALGAVAVAIPPTEVPEAIARRTIDATTSQPAVIYDFGYDRVTHDDYFIRLGVVPLVVLMNKAKFNSLSPAQQDALRSHGLKWAEKIYIDKYSKYENELVSRMRSDPRRTVVFPSVDDENVADRAFQETIKEWIKQRPGNQNLYVAAEKELKQFRAEK